MSTRKKKSMTQSSGYKMMTTVSVSVRKLVIALLKKSGKLSFRETTCILIVKVQ